MPILKVMPEKRAFLAIIAEYDLNRSICELVDNAIDLWTKQTTSDLTVKITLNEKRQIISVEDNSGGIEEERLDYIIAPGKTTNDIKDDVIGYFGIGSVRALVALAEDVRIFSRHGAGKVFEFHFDDRWINEVPEWDLPYAESTKQLLQNTTFIELSKLRTELTKDEISALKVHLAEVYALFIQKGAKILVNGELIKAIVFDKEWTFATGYEPKTFTTEIQLSDRKVDVEITTGLINHSGDKDNSYGIFFYCNNRLVTRGQNDFLIGFTSGLIGNPHYNISLVRTIIKLKGQSRDMPWNSSKSGIDPKHQIFKVIRDSIILLTKKYVQVCRSLQGKWDEELFPFKKGKVKKERLDAITDIPESYLPTPPASKPRWHQKVTKKNAVVVSQKPWVVGLQDSIVAADMITNTSLEEKERIALIIIDSALEIGYKEYLLFEQGIGMLKFKGIYDDRTKVQNEVFQTIGVSSVELKKIKYYYKLRCDLIHTKTTPTIKSKDVSDYRLIVENLFEKMFGLDFKV